MASKLQEAYRRYFNEKLRKYGVTSPSALTKSQKSRFFTEVSEDWQKRRRRIKDKEQLKTKYTNQYLRHVKRRFNISKYKLESGMLLELRYQTVDETTGRKRSPRKYFVLVLHPNWKKYMHGLRLDYVQPQWTRKMIESVGLEDATALPKLEKLNVKQMALNEDESRRFYYKELKPFISSKYNDSYRTFRLDRFSIVNIYNFDWSKF